jgi:myo-inositol-1(or 4)-monophosphatase
MSEFSAIGDLSGREIENVLYSMADAAHSIGPTLADNFGCGQYSVKADGSLVSPQDFWAQANIREYLSPLLTSLDIHFLGEEEAQVPHAPQGGLSITVDPIDGSRQYIFGRSGCTTMLALIRNGDPLVSVIYDFLRKDTFWAVAQHGAYQNSHRLEMRPRLEKQAKLVGYINPELPQAATLRAGMAAGAAFDSAPPAGYTFTRIALGLLDGFVSVENPYSGPWDLAPGMLLIREAGGLVANDPRSMEFSAYVTRNLLAGNQQAFRAMGELIMAHA